MMWSLNPRSADAGDALSEVSTAVADSVGWRTSIRTAGRFGFGRCAWRRPKSHGLPVADSDPGVVAYEVPIRPTILGPGMFP